MKTLRFISSLILSLTILFTPLFGQTAQSKLGENAALRYWAAFAEMQDTAFSEEKVKNLDAVLEGTAPYDDSKYGDLVEKNKFALDLMGRGAALQNCDWEIDYALGDQTPVDYVRKAMILGRLNVLYVFHLMINKDQDRAVDVLARGLRFSHDVANGGTLFSTLVAENLLISHLRAIDFIQHMSQLTPAQKTVLSKALTRLGNDGLDWNTAVTRELNIHKNIWNGPVPLATITQAYVEAVNDESTAPKFQELTARLPENLRNIIPNPRKVAEHKQSLSEKLSQVRTSLQ
jgi:hypothetical protein